MTVTDQDPRTERVAGTMPAIGVAAPSTPQSHPDMRAMTTTKPAESVRYRVLGPIEVIGVDGRPLELRGQKLRSLLCALLVSPGQTVSLDRIISHLWGDEPPAAATATLQAYVSQLRKLLEPERGPRQQPTVLVTRSPGYALVVEPGAIDADELDELVTQGEEAMIEGRFAHAEDRFSAAVRLRRGTPFADVADEPFAVGSVVRLDQLLLVAEERRIDALLALGRLGAAAADLERLVAEHPLRERFWGQLIEALYRSDRQADALRTYQTCRTVLTEELGVEPSPSLQEMERAILAQEPLGELAPSAAERARFDPDAPVEGSDADAGRDVEVGQLVDHGRTIGGPVFCSTLIGRSEELDTLEDALVSAAGGLGSIVTVEGESGIGKSRFAEEALQRARYAGFATSWTSCVDQVGTPALWPWEETLISLGQAVPAAVDDPDPDTARFRRVLDVLNALIGATRDRPAFVVLDDVQWADVASLQALSVLSNRLRGARLVVLVTVRRPDVHEHTAVQDLLADLGRQRNVHRLRMGGLGRDQVAELVEDLAGRAVHDALVGAVVERTDGNPFFVSEMVRLLASENALAAEPSDALLESVPDSVREVVERRLGRLPEDSRTLLRLAAITGPVIELAVLEQATGLEADRVVTLMDAAVMTGMLAELDDRIGWRFTHALVQDAVRAGLGRAQRARLHATLVEAIEIVHADDLGAHLDELAHHSVEAALLGRSESAIGWCRAAALDARANGRFDRAARLWQSALDVLDASSGDQVRHVDLSLELAPDLRASGDTVGFGETVAHAVELASRLRDDHRVALAAAELGWVNLWNTRPYGMIDRDTCDQIKRMAETEANPDLAARLLGAVAVELYYGERRADGEQLARRAVDIARELDDPVLLGRTLNNFVLAAWVPDRYAERLEACDESLALVGRGLPAQTEVVARLHRASTNLRFGEIALVESDLARCRSLITELTIPEISAQLMYIECGLGILRGQWSYSDRLAAEAFDLHTRTKVWGAEWCRLLQLVAIRDAQGRVDEVAGLITEVAAQPSLAPARPTAALAMARSGDLGEAHRLSELWNWREEPVDWSWDHQIPDWAEVAALTGSSEAKEFYDLLVPFEDRLRVSGTGVVCRGSMHGVLAMLAAVLGDDRAVERHRAAAEVANRAVDGSWWTERLHSDLDVL